MVGLMGKMSKLFQGLTLMVKDHPNEFVWATEEEIPKYLKLGYKIVNEVKRAYWEKIHGKATIERM